MSVSSTWAAPASRPAILGAVVSALGLLLPALNNRANRLVDGAPVAFSSLGWPAALVALGLLATFVFASGRLGRQRLALAAALSVMLVALCLTAGLSATRLLATAGPFARVSLGGGWWLALFGWAGSAAGLLSEPRLERAARWTVLLGPLAAFAYLLLGGLNDLSVLREYAVQRPIFVTELGRHLALAGSSLALATLIGLPLGWAAGGRGGRFEAVTLSVSGLLQTIPSLALLGVLITPFAALAHAVPALAAIGVRGIGAAPAVTALTLYGLLPIVRAGVLGRRAAPPATLDAGRGLGMTRRQLAWRVEAPPALPIIASGLRLAAVQLVGLAAVASLIGAGGLGFFIFSGLGSAVDDLVLLGAVPVIVLAVLTDTAFRAVERVITPGGLRV